MKLYVKLFNGTFNKYLIIFYHFASQLQIPHLGYPGTRGFFSRVAGSFGPKHPTTGEPPPPDNIGFYA